MLGAATQAMPLCIVEERQQRRRPLAAAPLRAAARWPAGPLAALLAPYIPQRVCSSLAPCQRAWGPAAKCKCYSGTGPKTQRREEKLGDPLRLRVFVVKTGHVANVGLPVAAEDAAEPAGGGELI